MHLHPIICTIPARQTKNRSYWDILEDGKNRGKEKSMGCCSLYYNGSQCSLYVVVLGNGNFVHDSSCFASSESAKEKEKKAIANVLHFYEMMSMLSSIFFKLSKLNCGIIIHAQ